MVEHPTVCLEVFVLLSSRSCSYPIRDGWVNREMYVKAERIGSERDFKEFLYKMMAGDKSRYAECHDLGQNRCYSPSLKTAGGILSWFCSTEDVTCVSEAHVN